MRDNVHPGEKWEFNGEVAACFANMLERSIPDLSLIHISEPTRH